MDKYCEHEECRENVVANLEWVSHVLGRPIDPGIISTVRAGQVPCLHRPRPSLGFGVGAMAPLPGACTGYGDSGGRFMNWAEGIPEQPGWYWYWPSREAKHNFGKRSHQLPHIVKTGEPGIVRVVIDNQTGLKQGRLIVRFPGGSIIDVRTLLGRWAGPLELPAS